MIGVVWGIAVLILAASAVLTASHVAASQIGASHVRTLQSEGFKGADALAEVRDKDAPIRASVRLVTRVLNLSALGIAAVTAVVIWGEVGPVILVMVLGILTVLVVADVAPHMLAARSPVRLALSSAPLLLKVARWTRPLILPVEHLEDRIVGGTDDALAGEGKHHRELREIQEIGEEEGVLEESESRLVERAFRLDDLTAWDVMVPRVDIFAWSDELQLKEIVDTLPTVPYSRVPVYNGSVDDVTGIVYVREAYERFVQGEGDQKLADLARAPFFVPGSLSLTRLLENFQARRIHMGIVADEFGGTDGLVTLEDVLEELVGEIHDETDVEEEEIVHVSASSLECDAGIDVREVNEALGVALPKAEHRSLNGFILEELGHVPEKGAGFERDGVRIEILEATETQVVRARLTRLPESPPEEG